MSNDKKAVNKRICPACKASGSVVEWNGKNYITCPQCGKWSTKLYPNEDAAWREWNRLTKKDKFPIGYVTGKMIAKRAIKPA